VDAGSRARSFIQRASRELWDRLEHGAPPDLGSLLDTSRGLVMAVCSDPTCLATITHLQQSDDYTIEHSTDVAILMVGMGSVLGHSHHDLVELALAGLMHDIGKQRVPAEVLGKPGRLTPEEWGLVRRHPQDGFEMLQDLSVGEAVQMVTLQHHERLDGTGYPFGSREEVFHPFSRLAGVADSFDAMTANRVYRKGMPPFQAMQELERLEGHQLALEAVSALQHLTGAFPVGTRVRLDTGDMGTVVAPGGDDPYRPVVRVDQSRAGIPMAAPVLLDLSGSGPQIVQADGVWLDGGQHRPQRRRGR
jgi:HD-GYP domain-containing protein (c-di-GMP phosphodiesterase class II)